MAAYYNEHDPKAAEWIRELIQAGVIAPGVVDERSIEDVLPNDLRGFTQCHFFAGIGVWSYALRRAGWSDDRPVWTGSCPCQPFSAAGKGAAFADERHLWPTFFHLIEQCRPPVVFGEQVASKDADPWIDLVQDDLEALGYAVGALAFPAAGIGAPHIRDRLYWMADADDARPQGRRGMPQRTLECAVGSRDMASGLEQPSSIGRERWQETAPGHQHDGQAPERSQGEHGLIEPSTHWIHQDGAGPLNGFWRDADWLLCRDGKWRPVEPGTFPLAHGITGRVGLLRGYGNAINAEAAVAFIEAAIGSMRSAA